MVYILLALAALFASPSAQPVLVPGSMAVVTVFALAAIVLRYMRRRPRAQLLTQ